LGVWRGLTTPHSKKLIITKVEKVKSWMDLMMMERVGDTKKWKDNARQAKAHSGLQCQWKKNPAVCTTALNLFCLLCLSTSVWVHQSAEYKQYHNAACSYE
jgi:hypothetical protein